MLTWPQNAGNSISEDPSFETSSGRMSRTPLKGEILASPYDPISLVLFCFVLLPCASFFQNCPGTNIVGRLSKLTEHYTQHHQVELKGGRAKVHKVKFAHQILGAFSESSREVQVDNDSVEKKTERFYGLQNDLHACIYI